MAILDFPPVSQADEHGLLAIGGDLEVSSLMLAYSRGIFPWPISDEFPLAWFSPNPRGIIFTDELHIPKSLKKELAKERFEVKANQNFEKVILSCADAKNRKDGKGTWISENIIQAYIRLFYAGHAYSIEVYDKETDDLVGGIYGVHMGHFFSGESMFYKESNASKVGLVKFIQELYDHGIEWFDTQMVTSVVHNLGGKEIPREKFLKYLEKAITKPHDANLVSKLINH